MSVTFRIEVGSRRVVEVFSGVVTVNELLDMQARLLADPAFDPDLDVLVDTTAVTGSDGSFAGAIQAARTNPFSKKSRCAVAASGDLAFGMARMYGAVRKGGAFEVFRSIRDAERWLGQSAAAEAS